MKKKNFIIVICFLLASTYLGYDYVNKNTSALPNFSEVPEFNEYRYIEINGNVPEFSDADTSSSFESIVSLIT